VLTFYTVDEPTSVLVLRRQCPPISDITNRRVRLKPDGTRWRTGGEVKGKVANGMGSQYSHTTSERGVSSITNADAHTAAASIQLNWRPRRFKWTRPFQRKTKSGFCSCAITFQTHYTWYNLCSVGSLSQRFWLVLYDSFLTVPACCSTWVLWKPVGRRAPLGSRYNQISCNTTRYTTRVAALGVSLIICLTK